MKHTIVIFVLILLCGFYNTTALSGTIYFTYSGPSEVTVDYGNSSVQGTYYFNYYLPPGTMVMPRLAMMLDGNLLDGGICSGGNESFLPSSYTFTFTPGVHTVEFVLNSLGEYEPCGESAITWQEEEVEVTCKFEIRVENKDFSGGTVKVEDITRPAPFDKESKQGTNFSIGGIDQTAIGYYWLWNSSGTNNSQ